MRDTKKIPPLPPPISRALVALPVVEATTVCDAECDRVFGRSVSLKVGGIHPTAWRSLARFDLSEGQGTVRAARLRLFVEEGQPGAGLSVMSTDDRWDEEFTTFADLPKVRGVLGEGKVGKEGEWMEVPISVSAIQGGTFNVVLTGSEVVPVTFGATGKNAPELLLEVDV